MPSLGGLAGALYNMGQMAREDKLRQLQDNKDTQDRVIKFYETIVGNDTLDPQVRERAFGALGQIIGEGPEKFKAERYSPKSTLGLDEFFQQSVIGQQQQQPQQQPVQGQQQGQQQQQGRPAPQLPMPTPMPPPGMEALPPPLQGMPTGGVIPGRGGFGGFSTPTFTGEDIVYEGGGAMPPNPPRSLFVDPMTNVQRMADFLRQQGLTDPRDVINALNKQNLGAPAAPKPPTIEEIAFGGFLRAAGGDPVRAFTEYQRVLHPQAEKDASAEQQAYQALLEQLGDPVEAFRQLTEMKRVTSENPNWQAKSETDAQGNVWEWRVNPDTGESTEPVMKGKLGKPITPGTFLPIVTPTGEIKGFFNPKDKSFVEPPVEDARTTQLSPTENVRRGMGQEMIRKIERLAYLGPRNKDVIGVIAGPLASAKRKTKGLSDEEQEIFYASEDLRSLLSQLRSGLTISDQQYEILSKLVPDPWGPYDTFIQNTKLFRDELNNVMFQSTGGQLGTAIAPPNPPAGQGKQLDEATAREYLRRANGDRDRARELARQDGYTF